MTIIRPCSPVSAVACPHKQPVAPFYPSLQHQTLASYRIPSDPESIKVVPPLSLYHQELWCCRPAKRVSRIAAAKQARQRGESDQRRPAIQRHNDITTQLTTPTLRAVHLPAFSSEYSSFLGDAAVSASPRRRSCRAIDRYRIGIGNRQQESTVNSRASEHLGRAV
jgi:hypothetical protein